MSRVNIDASMPVPYVILNFTVPGVPTAAAADEIMDVITDVPEVDTAACAAGGATVVRLREGLTKPRQVRAAAKKIMQQLGTTGNVNFKQGA